MEAIILSALGGLCIQLLGLIEIHKLPKSRRPDFKDVAYWIPYIVNPFFGGLVGYAYFAGQAETNRLLAVHIGASAPLLLRTMVSSLPNSLSSANGGAVQSNSLDSPKVESVDDVKG